MENIVKFLKHRLTWFGIAVVFIITSVLALANLGSSSNPIPIKMPVALVMLDQGVTAPDGQIMNFGKILQEKVSGQADAKEPPLEWTMLTNEQEALHGLNQQKYYAALIIPQDMSTKVASIQGAKPVEADALIYINQGMNTTGANLVSQILGKISDGMNTTLRQQILQGIKEHGDKLNTAQAASIATPIHFNMKTVNTVPTHSANGNAPISLTQIAWLGGMISSIFLFFALQNSKTFSKKRNLSIMLTQNVIGLLYAAIASVTALLWTKSVLGVTIPDTWSFIYYYGLVVYIFFLLQSFVLNWVGIKGIGVFMLIFFFGAPILTLPSQMLPMFSRDWIYSWLPLRFGAEIFRNVLYFGQDNNIAESLNALCIAGGIALVLSLFSVVLKTRKPIKDNANAVITPLNV